MMGYFCGARIYTVPTFVTVKFGDVMFKVTGPFKHTGPCFKQAFFLGVDVQYWKFKCAPKLVELYPTARKASREAANFIEKKLTHPRFMER